MNRVNEPAAIQELYVKIQTNINFKACILKIDVDLSKVMLLM